MPRLQRYLTGKAIRWQPPSLPSLPLSPAACGGAQELLPPGLPIISVSKGIEVSSGQLMSEVIPSVLGKKQPTVYLSGEGAAAERADCSSSNNGFAAVVSLRLRDGSTAHTWQHCGCAARVCPPQRMPLRARCCATSRHIPLLPLAHALSAPGILQCTSAHGSHSARVPPLVPQGPRLPRR